MKYSIRERYFKIHLVLFGIAFVLTTLTYLMIFDSHYPYNYKELFNSKTNTFFKSLYVDLDGDGNSIKLVFGKATDTEIYFVVVYNDNGTIKEQYNFFNRTIISSQYNYDLNKDEYSELVVFTRGDSTLFVSVIDVKNNDYLVREKPIMSKPKEVTTDFWDLKEVMVQFSDLDGDNNDEMYLSPLTGHSIYPRGLYVYDMKTLDLIRQFPTTAPISDFRFYDIDDDHQFEIIARAASSGNTRKAEGINDRFNWLLIMDNDLKLIRKPLIIGEFLTGFEFDIVRYQDVEQIIIVFFNHKSSKPEDSFSLYDFDLNLLRQQKMAMNSISGAMFQKGNNSDDFFVTHRTGEIEKYNLNFEKISSIKMKPDGYSFLYIGELCDEKGQEIVLRTAETIYIFSSELKLLFKNSFNSIIENFSLQYSYDEPYPNIFIDTEQGQNLFSLEKNLIQSLKIPLLITLALLYFLIVFFLHRLTSRVTRVLGAYSYSYDDVDLGILITDYSGKIKSYNKNIFINLPPDSNIQKNKSVFTIFHNTKEIVEIISAAFRTEKEVIQQLSFMKGDFRFIGKVHILPLFTMFKVPHAFIIKIQNFTKEIESDRSMLWSKIAQKIAHDIKTPLSTIQLNLSALKSRLNESKIEDNSLAEDDIVMIQNEIKQITELTRSFLKFSNLEKPNFQWIDINEIIERSTQSLRHYFENGIEFVTEISQDVKSIWVDPNQIVQLTHIFLENAIDAVDSNGQIKISVNLVEDLQHLNGGYVELLISDNGKGISNNNIGKVFEPYYTEKQDGTGMGLTIAKKIVEDHNGKIDVNSKLNFGTTITIYLPNNQE